MSYEGYTEYLCANGHQFDVNVYARHPAACSCGATLEWYHDIDETNGYDPRDPRTFPAPKQEVGFDDVWHTDHYGNRYATKNVRYEPVGTEWRGLKSPTAEDH